MGTSPMHPLFKKGDKCYYEYTLQTVRETNGRRITELNDGVFSHSAYDFTEECFPVEPQVEKISSFVANIHRIIFDLNFRSLNYPDIARYLNTKFIEMCNVRHKEKELNILYNELELFKNDLCLTLNQIKNKNINSVDIFQKF